MKTFPSSSILNAASVLYRAISPSRRMLTILALVWVSFGAVAEESVVLEIQGTSIRGNQELPTVLYLVPWQAPSTKSLEAPQDSLASRQSLESLERSEFQRMLGFHDYFLERQSPPESAVQP